MDAIDALVGPTPLATVSALGSYPQVTRRAKAATFQMTADPAHSGTTTVAIEVKNDAGAIWLVLGTMTVTGGNTVDGIWSDAAWIYTRVNCTGYTGSGDAVVTMGE
jgi:hypothetical protein